MGQDATKSQPQNGEQKEEVKKEETPANDKALLEKLAAAEADAKKALEEAADWKNKYYLELADLQNLRKDLEKDHREAIKYRAEGFLENLLPALDSFYIALASPAKDEEAKRYQQGFQYIFNQIENTLTNEGVSEILPKVGDKFDATTMHAVDVKESDGEEGLILQVFAKGYRLHERLVRPVMVCVSKKKVESTPDQKKDSEAHKA